MIFIQTSKQDNADDQTGGHKSGLSEKSAYPKEASPLSFQIIGVLLYTDIDIRLKNVIARHLPDSACLVTTHASRPADGTGVAKADRLPPEERLCGCGPVQTERHVAQQCPLSQTVRDCYQFTNLEEVFADKYCSRVQCKIIFDLLEIYK